MTWLVIGLALFLGAHSIRIFADSWRDTAIRQLGAGPWKGLYTLVSFAGFALIIVGYGETRGAVPIYVLPHGMSHATFGLVWAAFICVTAAYTPHNHIKHLLHDPMVFGVGLWALGHLLVNATPGAIILFGGFLVWAAADYLSLRKRAVSGATAAPPKTRNTVLVVLVGTVLAGIFAHMLHAVLIGVSPFG